MNKQYSLKYLPLFAEDLQAATDYISNNLHNPEAAQNLASSVETAILKRLSAPESFEPFQSARKRKNPYYRIYVNNYCVFYVVIDDIMEVRRLIYVGRNVDGVL